MHFQMMTCFRQSVVVAREKEVESTCEGDSTFAVVVSVSDLECLRQAKNPTSKLGLGKVLPELLKHAT